MAQNTNQIPYTEIIERVAKIARSENDLPRVRGAVNDVYTREIPSKEDWIFLKASSAIVTTPEYKTGTATVNTGATSVTFSSDTVLDATFTGRKIKFSQNPDIYDVTFSNTTAITISPSLSGATNISGGPYSIFQPIYSLAPDFERFPKNGGLYYRQGGQFKIIPETHDQGYFESFTASPGTPSVCRVITVGTDGVPRVEVNAPPSGTTILGYEFFRSLPPMAETTSGFVDINSNATAVAGSAGTTRFTEASTGWFFRISAFGVGEDSRWYRLSAIATNSSATLAAAFGLTGATTATYVMSAAPQMPDRMHRAILAGAVRYVLADQNDQVFQYYDAIFKEAIIDARKLYKTRIYFEHIESAAEDWQYRR